jgi:hypothetical protein
VDKSLGGLDREDVPYVSAYLKKFVFPLLLRDPMFFDNSHIFLVMAGIDSVCLSFNEEVELTSCFRAH